MFEIYVCIPEYVSLLYTIRDTVHLYAYSYICTSRMCFYAICLWPEVEVDSIEAVLGSDLL